MAGQAGRWLLCCGCLGVLAGLAVLELTLGSVGLGARAALEALRARPRGTGPGGGAATAIVWDLRLPQVILAVMAGANLATAGAPLAMSRGGDRFGSWTVPLAALGGALLSTACGLALSRRRRDRAADAGQLVIGGLAVSFLFGACTDLLLFSGDQRAAQSVMFWSLGGLGLAKWGNLPLALCGLWWCWGAGVGTIAPWMILMPVTQCAFKNSDI